MLVRQPVHFESSRFDSARKIPVRQPVTSSYHTESLRLEFPDLPSPAVSNRSSAVVPCPLESVDLEKSKNNTPKDKIMVANKTKHEKLVSFIGMCCLQSIYI